MTKQTFVDEMLAYHLHPQDLHLTYEWKGGMRTGRYKLIQAIRCNATGLCGVSPYPDNWRISPEEKLKIRKFVKIISSSGNTRGGTSKVKTIPKVKKS